MIRIALLAALTSFVAFAQPLRNPDLEKAQGLMGQKKYDQALVALEAANKKQNLDRDTLLTILELRGLAEGQNGKLDASEQTFRTLLALDPKRELTGKYQGKVAGVIASAQAWLSTNGPLDVGPLDPGAQDGRVKQISLYVKNDASKLARSVRFHLKGDGGVWKPTDATLVNGAAAMDTNAEVVDWWAEILGERGAQLAFLGSAGKPIHSVVVASAPKPAAVTEPKVSDAPKPVEVTPAPTATSAPSEAIVDAAPASSGLRTTGYVLLGAGVVAAGIGAYFGVTSSSQRDSIKADLASGGMSQQALYDRDQIAISNATIANILFAAGGALGLTGGVLWFLGRDVTVTPGAGGFVISGRLP